MEMKINKLKTDLIYTEKSISAQRIIDFVLGRVTSKAMLLEFQKHNDGNHHTKYRTPTSGVP
ncbi:hypothetical protein AMR72_17555 [Flavobacterium psychrophilum]|nr:hypothetical protein AMR72_17555 [Flavobacterium psychrophilum]